MKVKYNRKTEIKENVRHIDVTIGNSTFRISESVDGRMTINKSVDADEDLDAAIMVFPRYSNEVDVK